jgi:hypothetical protein
MSPDPSGLYFADPTNPQSLNLYAYSLNNPLRFVDPNGLDNFTGSGGNVIPDDQGGDNDTNCANVGGTWNVFTPPANTADVTTGEDSYDTTTASSSYLTCQSLSSLRVSNVAAAILNTLDQIDHSLNFLEGTATAYMMTSDFFTGQGPQLRQFGPGSVQSQQLAESQGVRQAVTD